MPSQSMPSQSPTEPKPGSPETPPPVTAAKAEPPPVPAAPSARAMQSPTRWLVRGIVALVILAVAAYFAVPAVRLALDTVSTDDAYVNGHVTFVAPRVEGQVTKVLVDDNNRVRKGELLVELDDEPYRIIRDERAAAFELTKADLAAAEDQMRAYVAQARSNRFKLEHAIQLVDDTIAQLRAAVAAYESQRAKLDLARADIKRAEKLLPTKAISQEEFDQRMQQFKVGEAGVKEALERVRQLRVTLGLPAEPHNGNLTDVPPNLDQDFSTVRQALADLQQSVAPLGFHPTSYNAPPKKVVAEFYKLDPEGNLDRIYAKLMKDAPLIQQARARMLQAQHDLEQAQLNLSYCRVVSEIDGVVTRRNVNPGNHVQAGQILMAVRSLTEIWIDANFKETQLAELRIGQRAVVRADMYGRAHTFEGRITGFTMGTGSTLALLPAQNATGNFIKVVQRLPVRIELTDYNPEDEPLFAGLSVVPYVYIKEPATGPNAGKFLQPIPSAPAAKAESPSGDKP